MIFLIPPRDLPRAASPCQETRSHAKDSILLLAKAQIKNANTGDLFAVPVSIPAYVRSGHVVAPHVAIRHKAPAEVSHARALIIPAHKPEPAPPNTAELIWRQGALEDPPGAPPAPTRNFGWDAVKLSNAYSTDELNAMYRVLARDPAGHNPEHAQSQSIYIYTPSTRKKMDAITWAITYHLKDKNHAASGNRDGSFKGGPLVMTKAMFFKAQIKGANTGDLFSQPVNVKGYVRNGHTVAAHTEVRQVRHEAPPAPKPKSYPWESASQGHMIHRMTDDELVAAMTEAVSVPRSLAYLDAMRISTKGRRDALPPEKNAAISAAMARAEGQAGRSGSLSTKPAEDKPKPALIIKKRPDMTEAEAEAFARGVAELPRNKLTGKTQMDDDAKAMFAKKKLSKKDVDLIVRKMVEAKQRPAA